MADLGHSGYPRLAIMADLLEEGADPADLTDLYVLHVGLSRCIRDTTEQFIRTEGHEGRDSASVARRLMDDLHSRLGQVLADMLAPPSREGERRA